MAYAILFQRAATVAAPFILAGLTGCSATLNAVKQDAGNLYDKAKAAVTQTPTEPAPGVDDGVPAAPAARAAAAAPAAPKSAMHPALFNAIQTAAQAPNRINNGGKEKAFVRIKTEGCETQLASGHANVNSPLSPNRANNGQLGNAGDRVVGQVLGKMGTLGQAAGQVYQGGRVAVQQGTQASDRFCAAVLDANNKTIASGGRVPQGSAAYIVTQATIAGAYEKNGATPSIYSGLMSDYLQQAQKVIVDRVIPQPTHPGGKVGEILDRVGPRPR